ncbi:MAG: tetratricopeptide repeat protein [Burkholderiaceae bacterium]|nr:tetratricopeptide repeat protein [Burkholderiaceae bacterium]
MSAGALYLHLGQPQAVLQGPAQTEPAAAQVANNIGPEQIEAMVQRLSSRLKDKPDDAAGWRMLARSYEQLGRFDQAVPAYRQLQGLTPNDADMLTDFAVTLGLSLEVRSLQGEPERLILQALKVKPDHLQALALAGSVAFEREDYALAAQRWRRVLAAVPADSPLARSVAQSIARVEGKSGS